MRPDDMPPPGDPLAVFCGICGEGRTRSGPGLVCKTCDFGTNGPIPGTLKPHA